MAIIRKSLEQILSDAWEAGVREGLNDANCRNFATDEEIAAVLHKHDCEDVTVLTPSDHDALTQALDANEPKPDLAALLKMHEEVQIKK